MPNPTDKAILYWPKIRKTINIINTNKEIIRATLLYTIFSLFDKGLFSVSDGAIIHIHTVEIKLTVIVIIFITLLILHINNLRIINNITDNNTEKK